jgi:acetolactate synthase I/II/III large subunit
MTVTTIEQVEVGEEMTGARAVVETLIRGGIEVVFGVAGHSNVALLDELSRSSLRYVGFRHEQLAVHAADGYFRTTHRPAVVLTTCGPGIANTISGLGDASMDGSAMIVICGEPQSYYVGRDAFQEVTRHSDGSSWEIARPLVKRAWRVSHPDLLTFGLATAYRIATTGAPGPVLLTVPLDLFSHRQNYEIPEIEARRATGVGPRPGHDELQVAAELLANAERPLLLAGGGAVLADADGAITQLAELLNMPVITTMSGQGAISKYHPLYAGFISPFGTRPAHALLQRADVVLVVGSKLAEFDMSSWSPEHTLRVPPTRVIQIDIEPTVIGRQYPVAVGLEANARLALEDLLAELHSSGSGSGSGSGKSGSWDRTGDLGELHAAWDREIAEALVSDQKPIQPERLMGELRKQMPEDGILFADAGIRGGVAQTFPVSGPRLLHFPSGWGTMGFAVGATLGAKIAAPDRVVVAEVGDGGFTSVLGALVTAVEHNIPVVWVVRNNAAFSSISVYHRKHFDNGLFGTSFATDEAEIPQLDLASIAAAAGAGAVRVTEPSELGAALAAAIASGRPYVVEVISEPAPRGRASGYWDVNGVIERQTTSADGRAVVAAAAAGRG